MNLSTTLLRHVFIAIVAMNISIGTSFAQSEGGLGGIVDDTKQDVLLVLGGGLAGAVLGLSTLSFVEEPKEHTRNILVGASIGIIAGVALVAFKQANKSRDLIYSTDPEGASVDFKTHEREEWHASHASTQAPISPYAFEVSFRY